MVTWGPRLLRGKTLQLNDTYAEGEFTIKDGSMDIRQRGEVIAYNGMPQLRKEWWPGEEVSEI